MMSALKTEKVFVGVDVSKFTLDVFHPDTGELSKFDNTEVAVEEFCRSLKKKKRSVMVVMEATGGYETLLLSQLAKHKIEASVLNPKRVRDFAKGFGADAKTDRIDAQVISEYARVVNPQYMATIVAIRHNPTIKAFYLHLKSKGKESKVAIVACMRKFLTILNLLIKNNELWRNKESVSASN